VNAVGTDKPQSVKILFEIRTVVLCIPINVIKNYKTTKQLTL